jgi:hypothetical protein
MKNRMKSLLPPFSPPLLKRKKKEYKTKNKNRENETNFATLGGCLVKDCNLFNLSFLLSGSLFTHQSQEDSVKLVPFHCSVIQLTGAASHFAEQLRGILSLYLKSGHSG